jgi:uncharacterized membrane protein
MTITEHRVTTAVDAPPAQVWRLFVDVEHWPQMIGSYRDVRRTDSGPLRVGSEAVVRQVGLPRARWRVTELEPGHTFTWQTTGAGLTSSGRHVVEASGQGAVVTLILRLDGPLARVVEVLLGRRTRRYLSMELDGFRRAAESAG